MNLHGRVWVLESALADARIVVQAVDSDTVALDGGEIVTMPGIDAPHIMERTGSGEWRRLENPNPRALAAYEWMRWLEGSKVRVTYDRDTRDRHGRRLAHLYLLPDGPHVESELFTRVLAEPMRVPPKRRRVDGLLR